MTTTTDPRNYYIPGFAEPMTRAEYEARRTREIGPPPVRYRFTGDIEGSILDGDEERFGDH